MMNLKGLGRKRPWPKFKVISRHSPEGTEENHEKTHDSRYPGRDLKQSTTAFGLLHVFIHDSLTTYSPFDLDRTNHKNQL
jgi:hypothetical protein